MRGGDHLRMLATRLPERLAHVGLAAIGLGEGTLDGPFLMPDGTLGMLVSLRGKDGGAMPAPDRLAWRRELPPRARTEAVYLFLRRRDGAIYLGPMRRTGERAAGIKALFALDVPLEEALWRELSALAFAPLPPDAEEGIAALRPDSSSADRLAAMRLFAARWFGCHADAPESAAGPPRPLRCLHGLFGDRRFCVQNRLVSPDERAIDDGKLIFYVESQGVYTWATDPEGEDPPVYVRADGLP